MAQRDDFDVLHSAMQRVLGFYRPGGEANVMLPSDLDPHSVEATLRHETIHRALAENTCFGLLQMVLAAGQERVRASRPGEADRLAAFAAEALAASRAVHEGVATFFEMTQIQLERGVALAFSARDRLPPLYRDALTVFERTVARLAIDDVPRDVVAYEIAEWAMNGPAFDLLPLVFNLSEREFAQRLAAVSPRERLAQLVAHIEERAAIEAIRARTAQWLGDPRLKDRAAALGDAERATAWAVYRALIDCIGPAYGDGNPSSVGNGAAADASPAFRAAAARAHISELADFDVSRYNSLDHERERMNEVRFFPEIPQGGEYGIVDETLAAAKAAAFVLGVGEGDLVHLHLSLPAGPFAPNLRVGAGEVALVTSVYRGDPIALDAYHLVIRVRVRDLVRLVQRIASRGRLVLVAAIESLSGADPQGPDLSRVAARLMAAAPLVEYCRRDGLAQLKASCAAWFDNNVEVKFHVVHVPEHSWTVWCAIPETARLILIVPLGTSGALHVVSWLRAMGGREPQYMTRDEFDLAIGSDRLVAVLDHYRRFGY